MADEREVRWVVFDLGETLVDESENWGRCRPRRSRWPTSAIGSTTTCSRRCGPGCWQCTCDGARGGVLHDSWPEAAQADVRLTSLDGLGDALVHWR